MCLAIPGRIVAVSRAEPGLPVAEVDFGGLRRSAQLLYVPEADVGEYVIVQAGFAVRRVPTAEAEECLRAARALAEAVPAPAPAVPPTGGRLAFTKGG